MPDTWVSYSICLSNSGKATFFCISCTGVLLMKKREKPARQYSSGMSAREAGERAVIRILWDIFQRLPQERQEELLKRARERESEGTPDDSGRPDHRQARQCLT